MLNAAALVLRPGDEPKLPALLRDTTVQADVAQRARIVLLAVEGMPNVAISRLAIAGDVRLPREQNEAFAHRLHDLATPAMPNKRIAWQAIDPATHIIRCHSRRGEDAGLRDSYAPGTPCVDGSVTVLPSTDPPTWRGLGFPCAWTNSPRPGPDPAPNHNIGFRQDGAKLMLGLLPGKFPRLGVQCET